MKQLAFFRETVRLEHGGDLAVGRRKAARTFSSRRPMHLVLRSSLAVGELSLRRHRREILEILSRFSKRFGIRIYESSVQGNHLHLLLRAYQRVTFQSFLRSLAGQIARKITGAVRGKPFGKFWELLAYTRLVSWGRDYKNTKNYVIQNELEVTAQIPYQARRKPRHKKSSRRSP